MDGENMAKRRAKSSTGIPFPFLAAGVYFIMVVVFFILGFKTFSIPIAAVGLFVVLEALLAALLNRIPLWIHGLVVVAQIACGAYFGKLVFMILMAVLYAGAICLLYLFGRDY